MINIFHSPCHCADGESLVQEEKLRRNDSFSSPSLSNSLRRIYRGCTSFVVAAFENGSYYVSRCRCPRTYGAFSARSRAAAASSNARTYTVMLKVVQDNIYLSYVADELVPDRPRYRLSHVRYADIIQLIKYVFALNYVLTTLHSCARFYTGGRARNRARAMLSRRALNRCRAKRTIELSTNFNELSN